MLKKSRYSAVLYLHLPLLIRVLKTSVRVVLVEELLLPLEWAPELEVYDRKDDIVFYKTVFA